MWFDTYFSCDITCPADPVKGTVCGGSGGVCVFDGTRAFCQCLKGYAGPECKARCPLFRGSPCGFRGFVGKFLLYLIIEIFLIKAYALVLCFFKKKLFYESFKAIAFCRRAVRRVTVMSASAAKAARFINEKRRKKDRDKLCCYYFCWLNTIATSLSMCLGRI